MPQMTDYLKNPPPSNDEDFDFEALASSEPTKPKEDVKEEAPLPSAEQKKTSTAPARPRASKKINNTLYAANKAMSKKRKAEESSGVKEKTKITLYADSSEHRVFRVFSALYGKSLSDLCLDATRAFVNDTYVCANPKCGHLFTVHPDLSGETPQPCGCPVCGGAKISPAFNP